MIGEQTDISDSRIDLAVEKVWNNIRILLGEQTLHFNMNIRKFESKRQILDINFVSLFSQFYGCCYVNLVSGKPANNLPLKKLQTLYGMDVNLSSPVEKPRSRFGGIVPDIL